MKQTSDAVHADMGSGQAGEQYGVSDMRWSKRSLMGLALLSITWVGPDAQAAPEGGQIVAGSANIVQSQVNRLDVVQQSERAAINWQSFGIGASEHVNFEQPSPQSATLNRVTGPDLSSIQGRLTANGNVFLVNPNGILFGKNAKIDVGGLVASTANISDQDFMAGHYSFKEPAKRASMIVNEGEINVAEGGLVALVAPGVENSGTITARMGRVALASGDAFTLDLYGDDLVNLAVDDSVIEGLTDAQGRPVDALVNQTGTIQAEGGEVLLTATEAQTAVDKVINMSGVIETQSVGQENGEIVLYGGPEGGVVVVGILDASGKDGGGSGGTVKVLGEEVVLRSGAHVDVSGDTGGGTVLMGGDYQGQGSTPRASHTVVEHDATVAADALTSGDGGEVIVWADGRTDFQGHISAKGGIESGDGGFIEVSGKQDLLFGGEVDLTAAHGAGGTLLLDPANLIVGETIQASSIENMLRVGANASLQADDTITVNQRIDGRGLRAGGGLDLTAGNSIAINNDILTDTGAVTLTATNGGITMGAGPADSITGGTGTVIATGSANISMTAGADIGVQHLVTSGDIDLSSRTGKVTLDQDLGGVFGGNPEIGGLFVDAATEALIDGRIIAGGAVTLSAPLVTLKHSIFTNEQDIVLGESGGEVILDPAGDETEATNIEARLDVLDDITGDVIDVKTRVEKIVTEQITLDTGEEGPGDIRFLGEVDIPVPLQNFTPVVSVESTTTSEDTSGFCTSPICYVSLFLSAGTGNISFPRGIATRAGPGNPNPGIRFDEQPSDNPNQIDGSTNTLDLRVESGATVTVGPESFVNSLCFKNDCNATVPNLTRIYHEDINLQVEGGTLPPIFPEPQLPGRFGPTLGGGALGLAQALAIASTVEETQREGDTACGEGAAAEGGEGQGEGDSCAPAVEAEGEELYAIESGPRRGEPAHVD